MLFYLMNLPAILLILVLFAILMAFFSQQKFDYFPIALIVGAIAVVSMITLGDVSEEQIVGFINFNALIFIFAMQIIIYFAAHNRVLDYFAIKLVHITKGNNRLFFYMICFFTGTVVAFVEDLTLSLILVPLIFRTCRILEIPAGSYMMGMTITINIGAILTPVSSLKNLIIAEEFGWGFGDFIANMGILYLIALISTVFLMDWFIIRKEEQPTEYNKNILLTMLDPKIVIENKFYFYTTSIVILATFALMILGITPALVAIVSAIVFAVLFILSNSLSLFGLSELISAGLVSVVNDNIFLAVLITLGLSTLLSAFLAGTPVTIILLPIFATLVGKGFFPNPIIIAFIGGVNMAGNFLPQGSACDLLTLTLAKKNKVVNLNYRRLLKNGSLFATLHFIIILGYTMIYTLIIM